MQLFIEPVDVWLFRDGRPFDAGSDHRAQSLFPPYPSVIQGAIRSHHLVVMGVDLHDKNAIERCVGTATDLKELRVRGPFVTCRKDSTIVRYYPVPADAARQGPQLKALVPIVKPEDIECSSPTPFLLWPKGEPEKDEGAGAWFTESALLEYLKGEPADAIASTELFERESRFGIARDETKHTGREGALYEVEFIRPKKDSLGATVGLTVAVEGLDGLDRWPKCGWIRMGGESRAGYFEQIAPQPWQPFPSPLPKRFKVYFATPTYFRNGWRPETWESFFTGKVSLKAAALPRYQSLGGFDLANSKHKAALRYVPAGSVYFFECPDETRLQMDLVQQAITDYGAEIGFGQILIGRW